MIALLKKQYHKKDEFKRVGESERPKIRYTPSLPLAVPAKGAQ